MGDQKEVEQYVDLEVWAESDTADGPQTIDINASPELIELIEEARRSPTVHRDRSSRRRGTHDEYCPKSRETLTLIDTETGDHSTFNSNKYLCFCEQLSAIRAIDGGSQALRAAYMQGRFDART